MDVDEAIVALNAPPYDDDDTLACYHAEINSKTLVALRIWEHLLDEAPRDEIARMILRKIFNEVSGYPGSLISPSLLYGFRMQMIPERPRSELVKMLYQAWRAEDFQRLGNLGLLSPTSDKGILLTYCIL
ncbi:hypothetical protein PLEOSDRAFT_1108393 [Pleurotus ostreatus PC15]|uniref:Uncharacterized protein n=1 Tax=Pleurotus ostreatus (strain PC15) TaxID=1137138 RepID=A0A067N7C9_PLEO1|nr:hypothetical protein PLEOSDRAFT_1108393 [Pleurotus ostreatus PC15]